MCVLANNECAHLKSSSLRVFRPPMLAGTRRSILLATLRRCSLRNCPMLSGRLCKLLVLRSSLTRALHDPMLSGKASIRLFSRRRTCRDAIRAKPSPISEMVLLDKSSSLQMHLSAVSPVYGDLHPNLPRSECMRRPWQVGGLLQRSIQLPTGMYFSDRMTEYFRLVHVNLFMVPMCLLDSHCTGLSLARSRMTGLA